MEPVENIEIKVVVLISADGEWQAIRSLFSAADYEISPFGEWFHATIELSKLVSTDFGKGRSGGCLPVVYFHSGWGKIAAAASTQYVIDRWRPELLVNLGTCGGFEGRVQLGETLLVERTIVYDIIERMEDQQTHIDHYMTEIDLTWLAYSQGLFARRTLLVSGDRDLGPEEIAALESKYGAVAGDWELGAIAWVAKRNGVKCLILRGVSDLVGPHGDKAYGDIDVYLKETQTIMHGLVASLPGWIDSGFELSDG